jgi:hypothetical protein
MVREEAEKMDNLVLCPCGHSLVHHDYAGCAGDRLRRCDCERDRYLALEAAVDTARATPVFQAGYRTRTNDAA